MRVDDDSGENDFVGAPDSRVPPRRSTFVPPSAETIPPVDTPPSGDAADPGPTLSADSALADTVLADTVPPADTEPPADVAPDQDSGLPEPPQRTSLPDDELVRTIDARADGSGGTLGLIDELQAQLQLREDEARELGTWTKTMLAIGTPQALASVEQARLEFTGVVPVATPEPGVVAEQEPSEASGGVPVATPEPDVAAEHTRPAFADVGSGPLEPTAPIARPSSAIEPEPGPEPTPTDQRVGRAARLFWLWFAANSSVLSIAFGGALFSLGMSLRQAIVAALAGVALSFIPMALGTLAGKWSGQPTMIVSRAVFGLTGNILPSALSLLTRLFWGAVLLWLIGVATARILVGASMNGSLSELQLTGIVLAIAFCLASLAAFFGYSLIARVQLALSILSAILALGLVAVTWPSIQLSAALTAGDGPWILVVTGAVLVFSFVGLVWATSAGDLARYQRPASAGSSSMLWAGFGTTLPAFLLIAYGALLAASNPANGAGLVHDPIDTIALMMPIWYPVPLIAAVGLSLLSGVVITIYSGAFALQSLGVRMGRQPSIVAVACGLAALVLVLTYFVGDFDSIFRDVATSLAVPVAAWAGIFAADVMIRSRRFDSRSLRARGGVYPSVNWVNLAMLLVAAAIGYGFTTATVGWLGWQGYLFQVAGVPLSSGLAASDPGVLVALVVGLLTPLVTGIPTVRRQEAAQH